MLVLHPVYLLLNFHPAIECLPLPPIANGDITHAPDMVPNYELGTVATYSCDAGFVLDFSLGGTMTRTCVDDGDNDAEGIFDGQAPACVCKFKQVIENFPDPGIAGVNGTLLPGK